MYGVTHIVSVDAPCPGCKQSLASHPRSGRSGPVQASGIVVICGRCVHADVRAPQKLCWALLPGPLTVDEYLSLYHDRRPSAPPCPACSGPTVYHGVYERNVAQDPVIPTLVPIYRFRCRRADCPVVTITLYPPFITPYMPFPTAVREDALRAHDQERVPWERIAQGLGVAPDTVRRWARRLRARAIDLAGAFMAGVSACGPTLALPPSRDGPALWALGDAAAHAVDHTDWPRLGIGRLDLIRGPMPVWA